MSIESGSHHEGADFKAPEEPKKKKTLMQRIRTSKAAQVLGLGAALGGGAIMMQEKAQASDWSDKVGNIGRTVNDMSRESNRHRERQAEIEARREEIRIREAARLEEVRMREAARLKQEEIRAKADLEREKTQRQAEALRNAERTGATKVKSATVGEETAVELTPGSTVQERMQGEANLHEKEMEILRQQNEFKKAHPDIRGKIQK